MTMIPNPQAGVTLRDIARAEGVSHVTVSRALNGARGVGFELRERILKRAADFGYSPNPLVATLMKGVRVNNIQRFVTIALLNAWPEPAEIYKRPFNRRFVSGVRSRAESLGYQVEEFALCAAGMSGTRLDRIWQTRSIDGVIVLALPPGVSRLEMDLSPYACAACGVSLEHPLLHRAAPGFYESMQLVLRNVRRLGYGRPGLLLTPEMDRRHDSIWTAAALADQQAHSKANQIPPLIVPANRPQDFHAWDKKYRPDVLITASRYFPIADWLKAAGRRVPQDISLVDLTLGDEHPDSAGIDQCTEQIGSACCDLVVEQLHRNERGLPSFRKEVILQPRWLDGASCPPKKNRALAQPNSFV